MKMLITLLLLAGVAALRADDGLISNGDFAEGLSHWYGNVKSVADVPEAGFQGDKGAVIKLHSDEWTKVTHDFQVKAGSYKLDIAFTIAADTHFTTKLTDLINIPDKIDYPDKYTRDARPGQWFIGVVDSTAGTSLCWVVDPTQPAGSQSFNFTVKDINFDNPQKLLIAFPPGTGYVTLEHVTLTPMAAATNTP